MKIHHVFRTIALAVLLGLAPSVVFGQPIVGVLGITREIGPVETRLQDTREVVVQGYVFRVGTINGRQVIVGRAGAGKVNAAIITTILISRFNPTAVFFSGTAGAIDSGLNPGDVVIGHTVAQHDVGSQTPGGLQRRGLRNPLTGDLDPLLVPAPANLLAQARQAAQELRLPAMRMPDGADRTPRIVEGVIVTGDVFMSDPAYRALLRGSLGATAVEMEGGAVVQTCRQFSVACLVVRSITDRADGQAQSSYDTFIAAASEHAARLVTAIIAGLK